MIKSSFSSIDLVAGPPPANPPLAVAIAVASSSLLAPIVFLKTSALSLLLGIAGLALALAGIMTMQAAIRACQRLHNDRDMRVRARIHADGIELHKRPPPASGEFFPIEQIESVRVFHNILVLDTNATHSVPGQHALRYGKSISRHDQVSAALLALTKIT